MKRAIYILATVFLLIFTLGCMTSCTSNDIKIEFHVDTNQLHINLPNDMVVPDAVNSDMIKIIMDDTSTVIVDLTKYGGESTDSLVADVKDMLGKVIPSFKNISDDINISLTRDYYGSSISGTTYYNFNIQNNSDIDLNVNLVSQDLFILNGTKAVWNEQEFAIPLKFERSDEVKVFELQYVKSHVEELRINIDISGDSPSVEYNVVHNVQEISADVITKELQSYGMHVSHCVGNVATFSETYDTNKDFQHVFPIQLYSVFGIVNTIDFKYGSFFTADGDFEMNFVRVPIDNVTINIIGQENTSFEFIDNGNSKESVSTTYQFVAKDGVTIKAKYSNVRWFASLTSLFVITAIALVVLAMIFIAKKRLKPGGYYGN